MEIFREINWQEVKPKSLYDIETAILNTLQKYHKTYPNKEIGLLARPILVSDPLEIEWQSHDLETRIEELRRKYSFANEGRLITALDINDFLTWELINGHSVKDTDLTDFWVNIMLEDPITSIIMLPGWQNSRIEYDIEEAARGFSNLKIFYHKNNTSGPNPPVLPSDDPKILS